MSSYTEDHLGDPIIVAAAVPAVAGLVQTYFGLKAQKKQAKSQAEALRIQQEMLEIQAEIAAKDRATAERLAALDREQMDQYITYGLAAVIALGAGLFIFQRRKKR